MAAAVVSKGVVIVTGASQGIGRQIAIDLAQDGYDVLAVSRTHSDLLSAVEDSGCGSSRFHICAMDVSKPESPRHIVARALRHGPVVAVVHNVGVHMAVRLSASAGAVAAEHQRRMRKVLAVNLESVVALTMEAVPHLLRSRGESYSATKAGLSAFASGLWAEVREAGILVSTVYPGLVATGMGDEFQSDLGPLIDRRVPKEEHLQVGDVSHAVLALMHQPRTACISDVTLQPQRDLFRQGLFANLPKLRALAASPGLVPFQDRRVALVTGASQGIGRAIVLGLAEDGFAGIVAVARSKAALDSLQAEVAATYPESPTRVLVAALDVTDTELLRGAVESAVRTFGTLSLVVSNAGVNRRRNAALCAGSGQVWEDVTAVNLLAAMHLTRLALPHLIRHEHRSAVKGQTMLAFVNSRYAEPSQQVLPGTSIYVSTKSGLSGFADAVMEDVRDMGVKVVSLLPGLVNTKLGRAKGPLEKKHEHLAAQPGDMIQPSDILYALRFALSCSRTACPTRIVTQSVCHTLPVIRKIGARFLQESLPAGEAWASEVANRMWTSKL